MKTLVCFGDSITSKEKSNDGSLRLTSRLRQVLSDWIVMNAGIPAETTRAAIVRLQDDVLRHQPDLVTILFGANDSSDHRYVPIEEYEKNLLYMVKKIGPEKVILISPAPVYEEHQKRRTNERIKGYAHSVKKISESMNTQYVPLFEVMSSKVIHHYLTMDGLHFNKNGYELLSMLVLSKFKIPSKTKKKQLTF